MLNPAEPERWRSDECLRIVQPLPTLRAATYASSMYNQSTTCHSVTSH